MLTCDNLWAVVRVLCIVTSYAVFHVPLREPESKCFTELGLPQSYAAVVVFGAPLRNRRSLVPACSGIEKLHLSFEICL